MKLTNYSIKLSIVIIFVVAFSTGMTEIIPQVSATISVDLNLDEFLGIPGLELLRGPPGPQGPQGEQGPPGETGATGADKDIKIVSVSKTIPVPYDGAEAPTTLVSVEVPCPENTKVTGGGYKFSSYTAYIVKQNNPIDNGWNAAFWNTHHQDGLTFTVYANCAKLI